MKILNNLAKFYKKHSNLVNIGGLIIIGCILIYGIIGFFYDNTSAPLYGNRLDGIKKVEIKNSRLKEVKEELEKEEKISSADVKIEGKIIMAILVVENDTSIDEAKKESTTITKHFKKDELKFYDIEIFVSKEDEAQNNFPIIGHKKADKDGFSWTKNREVSK